MGAVSDEAGEHTAFHPGKCARVLYDGVELGIFGELHPQVQEHYSFGKAPVIAAEIDLPKLLKAFTKVRDLTPVPTFPPVLEDLAIVVDEDMPAAKVEATIYSANHMVSKVELFDIFRGEQVGAGKKSLAYKVTYQADQTLTDKDAAKIRKKIIGRLRHDLDANLRE